MDIILLHSAQVEASRNVLAGLPIGVTVIDKHSEAVAACPNFSAYPALVVKDGDTMRVLSPFSTWAEAQAFIDNTPAPPVEQRKMELTKLEFLSLFTDDEKVQLKALESTNPVVALFWEEYRTAETIRLDDPRTVRAISYLAMQGYITDARKNEILNIQE